MERIVLAAAVLCLLAGNAGAMESGRLYECTANQHFRLGDDGKLNEASAEIFARAFKHFTYDESSQLYRDSESERPTVMTLHQRGSMQNGVVAVYQLDGLASYVVRTLRIRTWVPQMPFSYESELYLATGTCIVK